MNIIHITTANGQAVQYDEGMVKTMFYQGLFRDDALYWKEGMSDWQPLHTLFEATHTHPMPPPPQRKTPVKPKHKGQFSWIPGMNRAAKRATDNNSHALLYEGISGWLAIFIVTLLLGASYTVANLIVSWRSFSPYFGQYRGLLAIEIIDVILSLTLMGFAFHTAICLCRIKTDAVRTAKAYLSCVLGYKVISAIIPFMSGIPAVDNNALFLAVFPSSIGGVFYSAIWYSYLEKSKRVKATYGRTNGRGPGTGKPKGSSPKNDFPGSDLPGDEHDVWLGVDPVMQNVFRDYAKGESIQSIAAKHGITAQSVENIVNRMKARFYRMSVPDHTPPFEKPSARRPFPTPAEATQKAKQSAVQIISQCVGRIRELAKSAARFLTQWGKFQKALAIIMITAIVSYGLIVVGKMSSEPKISGHRVGYWVEKLEDRDPTTRGNAVMKLRRFISADELRPYQEKLAKMAKGGNGGAANLLDYLSAH